MPRPACLAVLLCLVLPTSVLCQPDVANRCVLWGAVIVQDGTRCLRFAPEPIPSGPYYLTCTVVLNGNWDRILTELAPKWSPSEDVNIPGNGFYGCELGNFADPEMGSGDRVTVILTDEAARQQGTADVTVPELPGAISCDVRLEQAEVRVPLLQSAVSILGGVVLQWDAPAPATLVYERLRTDRYESGKPRGQYALCARLTGGETSWRAPTGEDRAWLIVQQDAEGRMLGRSREVRTFREPDGFESLLAVTPSGVIYTVDVGAGQVTVRDAQGSPTGAFAVEGLGVPELARAEGENLALCVRLPGADPEPYSLLYTPAGALLRERRARITVRAADLDGLGVPRALWPVGADRALLLDGLSGTVRSVVRGTKHEATFRGLAVGGLRRARDIAVRDDGLLYILDSSRIIIVPPALEEEVPSVERQGDRHVVRWRTGAPVESTVTATGQGREQTIRAPGPATRSHRVTLGPLEPGKYHASVSHSLRVLGAEPSWATADFVVPPARKGRHAFLRVKLAVVILANVVRRAKAPADAPLPGPIPEAEIERLKRELLIGQRFYWINSHLRFFPEMDFLVDRDFHDLDPYEDAPSRANLADLFAREGKQLDDYAGVCRLVVEQVYDAPTKTWRIASSGGGLTSGLSKGSKDPGWSWWPAGAADFPIPDSWLFVHEYGHQVDAMFDASGEPSFWGNHFAPQEGNVARFGEHFDGNAYLLRLWPEEKWFTSDWGTVEFAADADEDGFPDDAPDLPLDETRFGSDAARRDTDSDGLSDRDEAMAWSGITEGLGQTWAEPIPPDPRNPDTDRDGIRDGADPHPLYPIPELVPRRPLIAAEGPLAPEEWPRFHHFEAGGLAAATSLAWDAARLYIGCRVSDLRPIQVQLDANDDGWFVGRDNYQVTVDPPREPGGQWRVTAFIVNAAEPGRWPFSDETLVPSDSVGITPLPDGGGCALVLAFLRSENTGLRLEAGERIGLNVGYGHPALPGRYLALFQPHALASVSLGK